MYSPGMVRYLSGRYQYLYQEWYLLQVYLLRVRLINDPGKTQKNPPKIC